MLPIFDARKPYPLSWVEQGRLFQALPVHLARMSLYKVNTGCREQEVCQVTLGLGSPGTGVRNLGIYLTG